MALEGREQGGQGIMGEGTCSHTLRSAKCEMGPSGLSGEHQQAALRRRRGGEIEFEITLIHQGSS